MKCHQLVLEFEYARYPKTVRKNVGDDYRGCLRIDVRRSTGLYRKIEGWAQAIVSSN